jgi:hypothetical protein
MEEQSTPAKESYNIDQIFEAYMNYMGQVDPLSDRFQEQLNQHAAFLNYLRAKNPKSSA